MSRWVIAVDYGMPKPYVQGELLYITVCMNDNTVQHGTCTIQYINNTQ